MKCHQVIDLQSLEPRTLMSADVRPLAGVHPLNSPNDPAYTSGQLYGANKISAPQAWDTSTGSRSVVVADIDTGADYAHSDLYLNIWINQGELPFNVGAGGLTDTDADGIITFVDLNAKNGNGALINGAFAHDLNGNGYIDGEDLVFDTRWSNHVDNDHNGYTDDIVGWDFANNDNDPYDYHGHGTHTAGTIGAIGDNSEGVTGVNWSVSIMVCKIFNDSGSGASIQQIATAIRYSADMGARVSNNSYGGALGVDGDLLSQAISYAGSKGELFVAAAGNDALDNDTSPDKSYPASYILNNIISVAATDANDDLASFSNFGATSVDIAAPGVNIRSTVPNGYDTYSGTSMATPQVTGAAALLLSINPNLTVDQLKALLLNNVDQIPSLSGKVASGGRLNLAKAVAATPHDTTSSSHSRPEVTFRAVHTVPFQGPLPA